MRCLFLILIFMSALVQAENTDRRAIENAIRDYIESQHQPDPKRMADALSDQLVKRTYWRDGAGEEFLRNTDYSTMLRVAASYNLAGDKFPEKPREEIRLFAIDNRIASAVLTTDDWTDYFHLLRMADGRWKIVNVVWQYHDENRHTDGAAR